MGIYESCKLFGPYSSKKDHRLRMVIIFPNGKRTTVSYPKYLVEMNIGRYLEEDETIDHIDNNFLNNDLHNLRIMKRSDHAKEDAIRHILQTFICPVCKKAFTPNANKLSNILANRKRKEGACTSGPYCSKRCAGKGSKEITIIEATYSTLKDIKNAGVAKLANAEDFS